jgi:ribosomal protein S18 acetylase RimI-like enzyme
MKIEFKIATEKEIPEILTMMERFNAIDNYPFDKEQTKENLFQFLTDKNLGRAWVIKSDQLLIGYLILAFGFSFEHGGRDAFIDELFLKIEFRQQGIGKMTMDFIQEEASKLGVKVVHLEVERHNEKGVKLYKGKGFKDNGRMLLSKKVSSDK